MNKKRLYEKIIYNIDKQVKRILNEDIQNFDVMDYEDTIEHQSIDNDLS